jgi:hypothetical protein
VAIAVGQGVDRDGPSPDRASTARCTAS